MEKLKVKREWKKEKREKRKEKGEKKNEKGENITLFPFLKHMLKKCTYVQLSSVFFEFFLASNFNNFQYLLTYKCILLSLSENIFFSGSR